MPSDTQLLPRHSAKQVRENGKQYYVDAKGKRLPSVTTILNATKPQEDLQEIGFKIVFFPVSTLLAVIPNPLL